MTVTPYTDDDDAIRIANDCDYGLAGTVWTTDDQRGAAVARRVEAGTVGINHYMPDHNSPMSMIKASGIGVKLGPESLRVISEVPIHLSLSRKVSMNGEAVVTSLTTS